MFSYEEYYKLYNSRKENEYREAREKLEDMLRNMQPPKEKGFREKIFLFLKTQAELLARFAALDEIAGHDADHRLAAECLFTFFNMI